MLRVTIPYGFMPERSYSIEVLLKECMGINYALIADSGLVNYHIELPNNNEIIIEDHFFSRLDEHAGYLERSNIPSVVEYYNLNFSPEKGMPVLYGRNYLMVENNHRKKKVVCGADIFASSFFMLTRWEEVVIKARDRHNRFDETLSLSVKSGFSHRAVVNEYALFLKNILEYSGYNIAISRKYCIKPGHDVDFFYRFTGCMSLFRAIASDILIRKSFSHSIHTASDFVNIKIHKRNDPYDTFDYLMDISDSLGLKSCFYFIPATSKEYGCNYHITDKPVKITIDKIISRGHKIGVHGGYQCCNDPEKFRSGYDMLSFVKPVITEGRQHFLRFDNPVTWQINENYGLKVDSTLGFTASCGFRCGICYEYSVFNILTRKKLNLKELPLIVMDTAMRHQHPDLESFKAEAISLSNECKKYGGAFVLDWHNSSFNTNEWKSISDHYEEILNSVK
jgi:hypothetical protein